jgi:hypothetical protein
MLNFNECKKILNKSNENYTDEEIKFIMSFIDHWARMNTKTIINNLNKLEHEKGSNNGARLIG